MPNFLKFICLAIPFFGFAIYVSYLQHGAPQRQAFEGWVYFVDWKSRNHEMPRIEISLRNSSIVIFSSPEIILDQTQLSVGDTVTKASGSKICVINGKPVQCLR